MRLREAIDNHPLLARYMHSLTTAELIPAEFRPSGMDRPLRGGLASMAKAWENDEFVLDPSRVSLYIGPTGIDGATFKREQLMDKFGIQINKTSRNTVLFMTNIGTTRSSVAYLIEVLVKIVRDLEERPGGDEPGAAGRARPRGAAADQPVRAAAGLQRFPPGVPRPAADGRRPRETCAGRSSCRMTTASASTCRPTTPPAAGAGPAGGVGDLRHPLPPGFPVLVPGQLFSPQILEFMRSLDTPEVHGYDPQAGYRVYTAKALEIAQDKRA